jgi:hypothetical protein
MENLLLNLKRSKKVLQFLAFQFISVTCFSQYQPHVCQWEPDTIIVYPLSSYAPNGNVHTPKGNLHGLVIFVGFNTFMCQKN